MAGSRFEAAAIALSALAVEYVARRFAARALPTIVSPLVTDLLWTAIALGAFAAFVERRSPDEPGRFADAIRNRWTWVGAAGAYVAMFGGAAVDARLWSGARLPEAGLPWSRTVVFSSATWLVPIVLVVLNGVVIPCATERVWRGAIQPRFVAALGSAAGVALTAALFSATRAVVDASLGRLVSMFVVGLVFGAAALKTTWRGSAIAHVVLNLVTSALTLQKT